MDKDTNAILEWVDSANLSRRKKNLTRHFSDGVLMAEVLKVHLPQLVDLHNYSTSSNTQQKRSNWILLNKKVLTKIGYEMTEDEIENIISYKANYIEGLLKSIYVLLKKFKSQGAKVHKACFKNRSKSPPNRSKSPFKAPEARALIEERYKSIIKEKDKEIESLKKRIKFGLTQRKSPKLPQ